MACWSEGLTLGRRELPWGFSALSGLLEPRLWFWESKTCILHSWPSLPGLTSSYSMAEHGIPRIPWGNGTCLLAWVSSRTITKDWKELETWHFDPGPLTQQNEQLSGAYGLFLLRGFHLFPGALKPPEERCIIWFIFHDSYKAEAFSSKDPGSK